MNSHAFKYAVFAAALVAAAGSRPVQSASPVPGSLSDSSSPFAINGAKMFHFTNQLYGAVQTRLAQMNQIGARWDRSDFWWSFVEPEKGRFDFSFTDRAVAEYKRHSICVLPILNYSSAWSTNGAPSTPRERAEFAGYVYAVVKRYPQFTCWEVWNEPNILPFWPPKPNAHDYAELLKVTAEAARRANSNVCLVAGALAGADFSFLEKLYLEGVRDCFDVVSYHYYRTCPPGREVDEELLRLHCLMRRFGDGDKPIWITEMGVSTHPTLGVTEELQAAYIPRNYIVALAHPQVQRIFQFDLQNWSDKADASWDSHLGLVRMAGRKPSSYAYKNMTDRLSDIGKAGNNLMKIDAPHWPKEAEVYCYQKNGAPCLVAWSDTPGIRLPVRRGKDTMTAYANDGSPIEFTVTNDEARIVLSPAPTYIEGVDPVYSWLAGCRFAEPVVPITPGSKAELKLRLGNPYTNALRVSLAWELESQTAGNGRPIPGAGLTLAGPGNVLIPPHTSLFVIARVSADRSASPDESVVCKCVVRHGKWAALARCRTPVVAPVKLKTFLAMKRGAPVIVTTSSANLRDEYGANVRVCSTHPSISATLETNALIRVSRESRWETPVRREIFSSLIHPLNIVSECELNGAVTKSKPLRVAVHALGGTGPTLDGKLNEWAHIPAMKVQLPEQVVTCRDEFSPDDGVGTVKCWWTTNGLYLAARIRDNDWRVNAFPPHDLWKGDALELYLGLAEPKEHVAFAANDGQLGIAFSPSRKPLVTWNWKTQTNLPGCRVVYAPLTDGFHNVEIFIPAASLPGPVPADGKLFSFDVSLKDYDANEHYTALTWNGDGANWKDASGWGVAVARSIKDLTPRPNVAPISNERNNVAPTK